MAQERDDACDASRREFVKGAAAAGLVAASGLPRAEATPAGSRARVAARPARASASAFDFDAVVVGSGFGGAVNACRLSERGLRVLVLERGRRWQSKHFPRPQGDATDFPRRPEDPFLWDQDAPQRDNGWFDIRPFPGMLVLVAAGVGGGSLAYSNVSVEPAPDVFSGGWPREIGHDALRPHYDEVGRMLGARRVPENQLTERFKLVRDAARKRGYEHLFRSLPLAVAFNERYLPEPNPGGLPRQVEYAEPFDNPHGVRQGHCVHLGTCNIGCDAQARNSLDLNYLALAERHGAEIRPLHVARFLQPEGSGWRVHFDRILPGERLERGSATARKVVLACGTLGTTELLLRCRDEFGTLPRLSRFLGRHFSSNANFLTPAVHLDRRVSPTHGPTISAAIDFNEALFEGESIHVEDGGFPDVLGTWLRDNPARTFKDVLVNLALSLVRGQLGQADADADRGDPYRYLMPWFAQGRDYGEGALKLRRFLWIFGPRRLQLDWDVQRNRRIFDKIVELHTRLARATCGDPKLSPLWTVLSTVATPHPLGGCCLSDPPGQGREWTDQQGRVRRSDQGVVDHRGAVFGYDNLYVADGSIIPRSIGRNPSRTIAALAERNVAFVAADGD